MQQQGSWGQQQPHPGQYPTHTDSFKGSYGPGMQQQQQWNQMGSMGQQGMPVGQMGSMNQMGQMGPMNPMNPMGGVQPAGFITPEVQCQQQGHIITSRYGVVGILSAILFFPCGVLVCLMDRTEKCERCHQIFKRGLLD